MQLRLKSRLVQGCRFEDVDLSRFAVPLVPDEARTQEELERFLRGFAQTVEAPDVEPGDMATIACRSSNPRFCRERITVRVGMGLYSRALEEALVGMRVGETRRVDVDGVDVEATVCACTRQVMPELTDELARRSGLPGVLTADDVREYCRFKQYDEAVEDNADDAFTYLGGEVVRRSAFELDEEEREVSLALARSYLRLDDEDDEGGAGAEAGFDQKRIAQQVAESTLLAAALGQEQTVITAEDYEEYLRRRATAFECTVEEMREREPLCEYLLCTYSDWYLEEAERYAWRRVKQLGEALAAAQKEPEWKGSVA